MLQTRKGQLLGWLVFLFSAFAFTISTVMARDIYGSIGSALFLAGCLWFIIPLLQREPGAPQGGRLAEHGAESVVPLTQVAIENSNSENTMPKTEVTEMSQEELKEHQARWLDWARRLQAISQTGLQLTEGHYDRINYEQLMELASEIVSECGHLQCADVLESFLNQPGYATVKVDVRGAVIRDGRILLVKERMDGRWCMPGGWADVGDKPSDMVAREVWEESGFTVRPTRVVGVYDANRLGRPLEFFHAYKVVMICEIESGEARPSDETEDVGFFEFDALPELSSPRTDPRHLEHVKACLADPTLGAFFD